MASKKPRRKAKQNDGDNGQSAEREERKSPLAEAEEAKDRLAPEDLYLLELHNTRAAWETTKQQLAEIKAQLLELKAIMEVRALRQTAAEFERQSRKHRRAATEFVVALAEKHGLGNQSWGYDDVTGTITINEPEPGEAAEGRV
jgi:hypothetical protein